jgi:acylphosphatase
MVAADREELSRVTAWVRGRVQGVGFRWWTRSRARELGLAGWARNLEDGRVEVVAQGSKAACEALLAALRGGRTPGKVTGVTERWSEPRDGTTEFVER